MKYESSLEYYVSKNIPYIPYLCGNIWQAGEVERDIKMLRRKGITLKSLGLRVRAVRITQYVGIFPNQISYINYTYEAL